MLQIQSLFVTWKWQHDDQVTAQNVRGEAPWPAQVKLVP